MYCRKDGKVMLPVFRQSKSNWSYINIVVEA